MSLRNQITFARRLFFAEWMQSCLMNLAAAFSIEKMKKIPPLFDLRVLVVEDTFLIAEDLVQLLSEWGCDVIGPASNLRSALHLADVTEIDAALLDVNLGGEMVFPVAEKLATRNIPFLFLTAYSMASAFPPVFREIPRVAKPFDPTALERTMRETLLVRS